MEDVIEELIGEEIVDETDLYVDVHKRISVARARVQLYHQRLSLPASNERSGRRMLRRAKSDPEPSYTPDKAENDSDTCELHFLFAMSFSCFSKDVPHCHYWYTHLYKSPLLEVALQDIELTGVNRLDERTDDQAPLLLSDAQD